MVVFWFLLSCMLLMLMVLLFWLMMLKLLLVWNSMWVCMCEMVCLGLGSINWFVLVWLMLFLSLLNWVDSGVFRGRLL